MLLTLAACGGAGGDGTQPPSAPAPPVSPSPPPLISGDSTRLITAALLDVPPSRVSPSDTSSGYLLTRVVAGVQSTATVAQLNAGATAIGATGIASSTPGSSLISLTVPRQASIAALRALAATLQTQPGFDIAWAAREAKTSVLPVSAPGTPAAPSLVSNLLATRFPQAWNARQAAPDRCEPRFVPVYVLDDFGDSSARPTFFSQIDQSLFIADPKGSSPLMFGHGYDVASVIAGAFDAKPATGANPFRGCVEIDQIEALGLDMSESLRQLVNAAAGDTRRPLIVNLSINFSDRFCGPTGDLPCDATTIPITSATTMKGELIQRIRIAAQWAKGINTTNLPTTLLITQTVGNVDPLPASVLARDYVGFRSASFSSAPALATHLGQIAALLTDPSLWKNPTDTTLPDATFDANTAAQVATGALQISGGSSTSAANLLLVDSGTNGSEHLEDVRASDFDFLGADIRAVAENVPLADVTNPLEKSGTSFAAPQIAGLASYLWILSPDLRAKDVKNTVDLIRRASRTSVNSAVPVIDAYDAVLSLDSAGSRPIARLGILDVNGDGLFDAADLQKFSDAYGLGNPNTPDVPASRDYSRFDLNGDGITGGIPTARFDLDAGPRDASGAAVFGEVDEPIESFRITFNEEALSDIQVLCYYAYSTLYASDNDGANDQQRTRLLGPSHCVRARINATLPAQVGGSSPLAIAVQIPDASGQFVPAANVLVQLTPHCATLSANSARTDANGNIAVVVTPSTGCTSISVDVVARADANSAPLATQTVTAQASTLTVYAGTLTRNITLTGPTDTGSDVTTVTVTMQVDATGKATVASASGQRSLSIFTQVPCHHPPNHTPSTVTISTERVDTLSGGNGGGQLPFGIDFSPFLVLSASIDRNQATDFTQPEGDGSFSNCITATTTSSSTSNFSPSGVNFTGEPITDANSVVTVIDFSAPAETGRQGNDVTVTTFSGQLLRSQ